MKCKSSCSSFSGKLPAIHRDTKPTCACPCRDGCPWDCCREIPTVGPCRPLLLSRAICSSPACGVNNVASIPSEAAWAGVRSLCGDLKSSTKYFCRAAIKWLLHTLVNHLAQEGWAAARGRSQQAQTLSALGCHQQGIAAFSGTVSSTRIFSLAVVSITQFWNEEKKQQNQAWISYCLASVFCKPGEQNCCSSRNQ